MARLSDVPHAGGHTGHGACGFLPAGTVLTTVFTFKQREAVSILFALYKLEIFLPEAFLPALQEALAAVDAGHIGNYDRCMSWSKVTSCWRPRTGTRPYQGRAGELCVSDELKVEVCCKARLLDQTLAAIRHVHPYEEPVINVIPLCGTGLD